MTTWKDLIPELEHHNQRTIRDGFDQTHSLVHDVYKDAFGRTPLRQRLEDIAGEANELCRYTDLFNLKEEAGDLLSSLLQLMNECGWHGENLLFENLAKIKKRKEQYQGLGRKVKVAILGGAFDPITKGHIQVAQFVLDSSKTFDEVWLMPCYQHMHGKEMVSPHLRLEMCSLACKNDGRIKVFDYEMRNKLAGETYHTMKRLFDEDFAKDQYDFSLIIGMDNANHFDTWVNFEDLERMMRFVVVPRTGEERDSGTDWYLKPPHIFLRADKPLMEVSSSMVREELDRPTLAVLRMNKLLDMMDEQVLNFIFKNKLYGLEKHSK